MNRIRPFIMLILTALTCWQCRKAGHLISVQPKISKGPQATISPDTIRIVWDSANSRLGLVGFKPLDQYEVGNYWECHVLSPTKPKGVNIRSRKFSSKSEAMQCLDSLGGQNIAFDKDALFPQASTLSSLQSICGREETVLGKVDTIALGQGSSEFILSYQKRLEGMDMSRLVHWYCDGDSLRETLLESTWAFYGLSHRRFSTQISGKQIVVVFADVQQGGGHIAVHTFLRELERVGEH